MNPRQEIVAAITAAVWSFIGTTARVVRIKRKAIDSTKLWSARAKCVGTSRRPRRV